jgi:hypothetical protein
LPKRVFQALAIPAFPIVGLCKRQCYLIPPTTYMAETWPEAKPEEVPSLTQTLHSSDSP